MAEFQEVMNNMARLCKEYWPDGEDECLKDCPLYNTWCLNMELDCPQIDHRQHEMQEVETKVMRWAAEHPEPVYPTWLEWLKEQGIYTGKVEISNDEIDVDVELTGKIYTQIPADIAQKLGIEPKEG